MTAADDCITAIEAALGTAPLFEPASTIVTKGYAYQALIFDLLVAQLVAGGGFTRVDPPSGPTFAARAGFHFLDAAALLSRADKVDGQRTIVQETRVAGRSGVAHQLDAVLAAVDPTNLPPGPVPVAGIDDLPSGQVIAAVECKNYADAVGIAVSRELLGLGLELDGAGWPRRVLLTLVSAGAVTPSAVHLAESYGHRVVEAAGEIDLRWAADLSYRLRYI